MCLNGIGIDWVVSNDLRIMMDSWMDVDCGGMKEKLWCSLFFTVMWSLWGYRNTIIF